MNPTPEQWAAVQAQIVDLANTKYPAEACGFVFLNDGPGSGLYAVSVDNVADWPYAQFRIKDEDAAWAFRTGRCVAMWHSHPEDPAVPSGMDEELAPDDLYFLIYAVADEDLAVFAKVDGRLEPQVFVMPS